MDANHIFEAAMAVSHALQKQHLINEKKAQIRSVTEKRCGNCHHWMKTSCVREKKFKEFKSINSIACGDYEQSCESVALFNEFSAELIKIQEVKHD